MMDRTNGGTVAGEVAHIRQCIGTILTTPLETRVMRRTFGSHVPALLDTPGTPAGALRLIAAATDAVERWEPRVRVERGAVTVERDGRAVIDLALRLVSTGAAILVATQLGAVG